MLDILMLVLGAFLCLGLMRIAIVGISPPQRGAELWPSFLFWVLAPGAGIAFLGWFTYGSNNLGRRTKATGHVATEEAGAADEAEVPDNMAFDSGLRGIAAE